MNLPNKKAAWMLDTSITALEKTQFNSKPYHKRLATLTARAALAGITLHAIEDDCGNTIVIVSRWAMTRQLDSLDAADKWLDKVTGTHHG